MHKESKLTRLLVAALVAVFVNFMFANTVFMHSHTLSDGSLVCHSHPFQHTGTHSHSAASLNTISAFNSAATGFQGTGVLVLAVHSSVLFNLYQATLIEWDFSHPSTSFLRAPPVLI